MTIARMVCQEILRRENIMRIASDNKYVIFKMAILVTLASCANGNIYTGDEYYYKNNGINWSCREPKAFKGGNCKPEKEWLK